MMTQLGPKQESERLAQLASYRILDTEPEFEFDVLTELAAQVCGCPVAVVGLIDEHRDWLKSTYGMPADYTECPRDMVVCNASLNMNDLLHVPDLREDDRFKGLPIVAGEPYMRFYCGMPLINREGYALGTLCVVDFEPRELTPAQRDSVRRLAQQTMSLLELRRQLLEREDLLREVSEARAELEREKVRSDALLKTILPGDIADELKAHDRVVPRYCESATVMFCDFRNFTRLTEGLDPARLVEQLHNNFARFDEIALAHHLEPLKTIGDAYLCVGGLPRRTRTHGVDACLAALQMQRFLSEANRQRQRLRMAPWELRIGINSGSVVAGIVGKRRFTYDIWGDAVNVAQRLEEACEPGRVNISASTLTMVERLFVTEPRGSVEVKHKGPVDMFFLDRIRPEFSANDDGTLPNEAFWGSLPARAERQEPLRVGA